MCHTSPTGARVCPCDTLLGACAFVGLLLAVLAAAQAPEEDFHVYKDHPRLLLTAQRLKLLEENASARPNDGGSLKLWCGQGSHVRSRRWHMAFITRSQAMHRRLALPPLRRKMRAASRLPTTGFPLTGRNSLRTSRGERNFPSTVEGARTRAFVAIALDETPRSSDL